MSAVSRPLHQQRPASYVVAYRSSPDGGPGYLACGSCGVSTITKADFASDAGVTPYYLNRWLNRQPVPEGVAKAIRANVLRVVE